MMPNRFALIVAGGIGKRMNSDLPKQFIPINGIPILMYTIQAFAQVKPTPKIVVVLPKQQIAAWDKLCNLHCFSIKHRVVEGGPERFFSVKNGLQAIDCGNSLVAIHDGVRPLVTPSLIENSYQFALEHGSAIPVTQPVESVRIIEKGHTYAFPRSRVRLVQTPQTFRGEVITEAYGQEFCDTFTDDASVVEALGKKVFTFDGEKQNIKITTSSDLNMASSLLQSSPLA